LTCPVIFHFPKFQDPRFGPHSTNFLQEPSTDPLSPLPFTVLPFPNRSFPHLLFPFAPHSIFRFEFPPKHPYWVASTFPFSSHVHCGECSLLPPLTLLSVREPKPGGSVSNISFPFSLVSIRLLCFFVLLSPPPSTPSLHPAPRAPPVFLSSAQSFYFRAETFLQSFRSWLSHCLSDTCHLLSTFLLRACILLSLLGVPLVRGSDFRSLEGWPGLESTLTLLSFVPPDSSIAFFVSLPCPKLFEC